MQFAELLDELFLALPVSSGALRDLWLATDAHDGRAVVVGAEIASTDETVGTLAAGLGVCLLAAGNAARITREGVTTRPVAGLPPSQLVLAWRAGDDRPLLRHLRGAVAAARRRAAGTG